MCAIAARLLGKPIRTFAIGMDGAIDLKYARKAAQFIGADHTEVTITGTTLIAALPKWWPPWAPGTYHHRASVGMYLCCKAIRELPTSRCSSLGDLRRALRL